MMNLYIYIIMISWSITFILFYFYIFPLIYIDFMSFLGYDF